MTALKFHGEGSEYFKIWIVNVMLIIVTLGLYYPWAKVRMKRYFYANTILEGRSFEYHATGEQLFKGYLIAMVFFIAWTIVSEVSPIGGLVLFGILFTVIPWVVWKSIKFNMRMTSYSNVTFSFHGGLKEAYLNFFIYPVLFFFAVYVTPAGMLLNKYYGDLNVLAAILPLLGMASMIAGLFMFAFMKQKNTAYLMGNIRYGQGIFLTDYSVSEFAVMLVKTSIVGTVVFLMALVIFGGGAVVFIGLENLTMLQDAIDGNMTENNVTDRNISVPVHNDESESKIANVVLSLVGGLYGGIILSALVIAAFWMAQLRAYVYSKTVLDGNVTFRSTLKAAPLTWVMVSNFIAILLTAGLAYPWTKVRLARLMAENTYVDIPDGIDKFVTQKQEETSALGEQIGDAFDLDIDIGF